jgi:predicted CXXCH cytochrome family protein
MQLSKFWQGFKPQKDKQTAEFWHNGTAHKNRVQGNTFLQSWMYRHAGLQCTTCHDPHGSRHRSMTIKAADDNALCLICHGPEKDAGPEYKTLSDHTHHDQTSVGSRCVGCHMPKTGKNSIAGESRNHTFDFISPAHTIKYGAPNSCNGCHADKTPEWALSELQKWSTR